MRFDTACTVLEWRKEIGVLAVSAEPELLLCEQQLWRKKKKKHSGRADPQTSSAQFITAFQQYSLVLLLMCRRKFLSPV